MAWDPTLYTFVGVAATILFFAIVAGGWQYRAEPAAKAFLALMSAMGGWVLLYAVGLGFTTLDAQLVWQRAALAIGGTVPTLWFLFAVQYTNRTAWLTRSVRAVMIVDPLVFGLLTLTNPAHGLIWADATLVTYGSLHALQFTFGPMYLVHLGYTYIVTPVGFGLLALAALRSTLYRTQARLLVLGAMPPLVSNAGFALGVEPAFLPPLDYTPFAFIITGPFFGLALFRFDLLERIPVARKRLIADADDGFVVLDEDERVVTANPAAERILGESITGRPIQECVPSLTDFDPHAFRRRTLSRSPIRRCGRRTTTSRGGSFGTTSPRVGASREDESRREPPTKPNLRSQQREYGDAPDRYLRAGQGVRRRAPERQRRRVEGGPREPVRTDRGPVLAAAGVSLPHDGAIGRGGRSGA